MSPNNPATGADTIDHPSKRRKSGSLPQIPGYEILEEIGAGGMGVVYKARHLKLKRLVALKVMLAGAHARPEDLERFRIEAEAVARLQHPNIVQIYEVGEWRPSEASAAVPYFALEFVEGGTLAKALAGNPQPPKEAAHMVETLARAMHAAHQAGIIHRDLKPGNVLLKSVNAENAESAEKGAEETKALRDLSASSAFSAVQWLPKIADFGLAKQMDADQAQTQTGDIMGTPPYMAPEQAFGEISDIDERTDVYALGAILYEMLTGRPPFKGATKWETLDMVRTQEPVPLRRLHARLPRDLETIALKCLQKDSSRRYRDAAALAQDLGCYLQGRPIKARPVGPLGRLHRWSRRIPWLAGVSSGAVIIILALFGWLLAAFGENRKAFAQTKQSLSRVQDLQKRVNNVLDGTTKQCNRPPSQSLDLNLAQAVLEHLEKTLREEGQDPVQQRNIAEANYRIGVIHDNLGMSLKAIEAYDKAASIRKTLASSEPSERENLAVILNNLGVLHARIGKSKEGLLALQESVEIREVLLTTGHAPPSTQGKLIATQVNIIKILYDSGDKVKGQLLFRTVSKEFRKLRDNDGFQARWFLHDMALLLYNFSLEKFADKKLAAEAFEHGMEALRIRRQLAKEYPEHAEHRHDLGKSLLQQARLSQGKDKTDFLVEAIPLLQELVRTKPAVAQYRDSLAMCFFELGFTKGLIECREIQSKGIAQAGLAVELDGDMARYRSHLAKLLAQRGITIVLLKAHAEAVPDFDAAIQQQEKVVAASPTGKYRGDMVNMYFQMGEAQRFLRNGPEAIAAFAGAARHAQDKDTVAAMSLKAASCFPLLTNADEAEQEKQAKVILAMVQRSVSLGLDRLGALLQRPEFNDLRNRKEFQDLL